MRVYLYYSIAIFLSAYAWRNWFTSLCGLLFISSVMGHPDFRGNVGGIQGLNAWNLVFINVMLGWFFWRLRTRPIWDMPRHLTALLLIYLGVVLVSFTRMMVDRSYLDEFSTTYLISEYLINTVKWVIPGLLLFDGCRSEPQFKRAVTFILLLIFLLGFQTAKAMRNPLGMSGEDLAKKSRKVVSSMVGYHPVNMSMLLAGGSWAMLSALPLVKRRTGKVLVCAAAVAIAYGQAVTAGRMGYVTWAAVGLTLCALRWRRYLLLIPLLLLGIGTAVPAAVDRMMLGFGEVSVTGDEVIDDYQVTSGRTLIWPLVLDKIQQSPLVGYGRMAMRRTGMYHMLLERGEMFAHPHNAYLEWWFDNGLIGLMLVMPFYAVMLWHSGRLLVSRASPECTAIGGIGVSLILALLVASVGSQTFYPREGAIAMWCAIGLVARVYVQQSRLASAEERAAGFTPALIRYGMPFAPVAARG